MFKDSQIFSLTIFIMCKYFTYIQLSSSDDEMESPERKYKKSRSPRQVCLISTDWYISLTAMSDVCHTIICLQCHLRSMNYIIIFIIFKLCACCLSRTFELNAEDNPPTKLVLSPNFDYLCLVERISFLSRDKKLDLDQLYGIWTFFSI